MIEDIPRFFQKLSLPRWNRKIRRAFPRGYHNGGGIPSEKNKEKSLGVESGEIAPRNAEQHRVATIFSARAEIMRRRAGSRVKQRARSAGAIMLEELFSGSTRRV